MSDDVARALLNGPLPSFDLVGPTVEDDVSRAIGRYGAEAVKAAAFKLTKRPRGNPGIDPFPDLFPFLQQDAREWLAGDDPFVTRKDNAIAVAYAESKGIKEYEANKKRAERFLRGERANGKGRRFWALFIAWRDTRDGQYPYAAHLRAIEALRDLEPEQPWSWYLDDAHRHIRDYEAKHGPPDAWLSIKEIEDGARKVIEELLAPRRTGVFGTEASRANGLFGLLGTLPESPNEKP